MFSLLHKSTGPILAASKSHIKASCLKDYGSSNSTLLSCLISNSESYIVKRNIVSFNSPSASQLWASVTGVSNAGKNRGRARANRRVRSKNLNFGQIIGEGKSRMLFPGLTGPVTDNKTIMKQKPLMPDEKYEERILKARDTMGKFKPIKLAPLERGWSGIKLHGRKLGSPFDLNSGRPENSKFDSVCIEAKQVACMTSRFGKVRRYRATVVVGNGNGLVGFSTSSSPTVWSAVGKAKRKAGLRLFKVRTDGDTIFHDLKATYCSTTLVLQPRPSGYGIKSQRIIKAICEMVGIKDLYGKIYGSTTPINVMKAALIALLDQKTHQEMADEKNLIVIKKEEGKPAVVLARPSDGYVRKESELSTFEELNYMQYVTRGLVFDKPVKPPKFYTFHKEYQYFLRKEEHRLTHPLQKHRLAMEYGFENSNHGIVVYGPLTSKYKEAKMRYPKKKEPEEVEE